MLRESNHSVMVPLLLAGILFIALAKTSSSSRVANYQLKSISVNSSSISITSFAFIPSNDAPEWVDALFGVDAVYWNVSYDLYNLGKRRMKGNESLSYSMSIEGYENFPGRMEDIPGAKAKFSGHSHIPKLPQQSACSIVMLGFVRLGSEWPFIPIKGRFSGPIVGTATLTPASHERRQSWKCVYRVIYGNKRLADDTDSFWTAMFYCPASLDRGDEDISTHGSVCESFPVAYENHTIVSYSLTMQVSSQTHWHATLDTHKRGFVGRREKIAVCTVWPYFTGGTTCFGH